MKSVVVIGSNSFSGAHFVSYCLRQGHRVIAISRSELPNEVFLPHCWDSGIDRQLLQFYQMDLNRDLADIAGLIEQARAPYVVNFAAQSMVAQSWDNPDHWFQTNVVATVNLHERLRQFDFLERYVHVSTPEVYGSCEGIIGETRQYFPSTPYAVSRAAADMSLHSFHSAYDFPVVFTRAANVFGPGQQLYRIVPRAVLNILSNKKIPLHGGGLSERSFIHIEDVACATHKLMTDGKNGEIYHISTQRMVSIRGLVELICERLNVAFDGCVDIVGERLGKDQSYGLDAQKLHDLGWSDQYSLEDGLEHVINWVQKNKLVLLEQSQDYQHKV